LCAFKHVGAQIRASGCCEVGWLRTPSIFPHARPRCVLDTAADGCNSGPVQPLLNADKSKSQ
jgi:hypothetical protein